jgi:hypothetical protein
MPGLVGSGPDNNTAVGTPSLSPATDSAHGRPTTAVTGQRVPQHIEQMAAQYVGQGANSQQLQHFMRSQGYPMAGAWCGEFTASMVHAAGGTPPKGAALASNWANYGSPVQAGNIHPGDIAINMRGGRIHPGQTGAHVGMVGGLDPNNPGTFTLRSGNYGHRVKDARLQRSQFTFRRGTYPEQEADSHSHGSTHLGPRNAADKHQQPQGPNYDSGNWAGGPDAGEERDYNRSTQMQMDREKGYNYSWEREGHPKDDVRDLDRGGGSRDSHSDLGALPGYDKDTQSYQKQSNTGRNVQSYVPQHHEDTSQTVNRQQGRGNPYMSQSDENFLFGSGPDEGYFVDQPAEDN